MVRVAPTPEQRERKLAHRRRWKQLHPERVREDTRKARERNPLAAHARNALNWAVRVGKIVPPERCEDCGDAPGLNARGQRLIEAHHEDYSRPLDVEWLCRLCHAGRHRSAA